MPVKLVSAGGGGVILQPASSIGSDVVVNVPSAGGTAMVSGAMPAFSAYQSSAQTLASNTLTKIQLQTEEFDTNNCFDNIINYRFTPNVAGYYQVTAHIQPNAAYTAGVVGIFKNGAIYKYGSFNDNGTGVAQGIVSCLVYLNGSTDYVEFYASFVAGQVAAASSIFTWFQGYLARAV